MSSRKDQKFVSYMNTQLVPSGKLSQGNSGELFVDTQGGFFTFFGSVIDAYKEWGSAHSGQTFTDRVKAVSVEIVALLRDVFDSLWDVLLKIANVVCDAASRFFSGLQLFMGHIFDYLKNMPAKLKDFIKCLGHMFAPDVEKSYSLSSLKKSDEEESDEDHLVEQQGMGDIAHEWYVYACSVMTSALGAIFDISEMPTPKEVYTWFTKNISVYNAVNNSGLDRKLKQLVNYVFHMLGGQPWFQDEEMRGECEKLLAIVIDKREDHKRLERVPLAVKKETLEEVDRLLRLLDAVILTSPKNAQYFRAYQFEMGNYANQIRGDISGSQSRIKPVSMFLFGESAAGKSRALDLLKEALPKLISQFVEKRVPSEKREEIMGKFFGKKQDSFTVTCVEDKHPYSNGYNRNMYYIFEELYTSVSNTSNANWAAHVFQVMGDHPLLLNTAFNDKGTVYFDSPFIFATGNSKEHVIPFKDHTAYYRRMDFDFRVERDGDETVFRLSPQAVKIMGDERLRPHNAFSVLYPKVNLTTKVFTLKDVYMLLTYVYVTRVVRFDQMENRPDEVDMKQALKGLKNVDLFGKGPIDLGFGRKDEFDFNDVFDTRSSSSDASSISDVEEGDHGHFSDGDDAGERLTEDTKDMDKGKAKIPLIQCVDNQGVNEQDLKNLAQIGYIIYNRPCVALNRKMIKEYLSDIFKCPAWSKDLYSKIKWVEKDPGRSPMFYYAREMAWFRVAGEHFDDMHDGSCLLSVEDRKALFFKCRLMMLKLTLVYSKCSDVKGRDKWDKRRIERNEFVQGFDVLTAAQKKKASIAAQGWLPYFDGDKPRAYQFRRKLETEHKLRVASNVLRSKRAARRNAIMPASRVVRTPVKAKRNGRRFDNARAAKYAYNQGGFEEFATDSVVRAFSEEKVAHKLSNLAERVALCAYPAKTKYTRLREWMYSKMYYYTHENGLWKYFLKDKKPKRDDIPLIYYKYFHEKLTQIYPLASGEYNFHLDACLLMKLVIGTCVNPKLDISGLDYCETMSDVWREAFRLRRWNGVKDYTLRFSGSFVGMIKCVEELDYLLLNKIDEALTMEVLVDMYRKQYSELTTIDTFKSTSKEDIRSQTRFRNFLDGVVEGKTMYGFLNETLRITMTETPNFSQMRLFNNTCTVLIAAYVGKFLFEFVVSVVSTLGEYFGLKKEKEVLVISGLSTEQLAYLNDGLKDSGVTLQSAEDKEGVPRVPKPNGPSLLARATAQFVDKQGGQNEAIVGKVAFGTYLIISPLSGGRAGSIVFLKGKIAVLNAHVYDCMPDTLIMLAYKPTPGSNPVVKIPKKDIIVVHRVEERDLVFVAIPCMRSHTDLTNHIMPENRFQYEPTSASAINYDSETLSFCVDALGRYTTNSQETFKNKETREALLFKSTYTWADAKPGACGTPIIVNYNGVSQLGGIHAAGMPKIHLGISHPVFAEDLQQVESMLKLMGSVSSYSLPLLDSETGVYEVDYQTGSYSTPVVTSAVGQTCFVPTPFTTLGFEEPPKVPAVLTVEAYKLALKKEETTFFNPTLNEDVLDIVNEAGEEIMDKFVDVSFDRIGLCTTLTPQESLYGYANVLSPFDFSTAEGIRCKAFKIHKRSCVDPHSDDAKRLLSLVEAKVEAFKKDEFTLQVNADCLKDETRDQERVSLKKTRLFNVTDFVDNILIKMALGMLVARLKGLMFFGPAMCGLSTGTGCWGLLYRMFDHKDLVATDFSGWDHLSEKWMVRVVYPWLYRFYGHNYFSYRFACWAYSGATEALRFNMRHGRRLGRGGSSGNWATTFINTLNNHIMHCVTLVYACKQHNLDWRVELKTFVHVLYSDDNISAGPSFWNGKYVADTMYKLFGARLTSTDKGDVTDATLRIGDVDFLCRKFVKRDGVVFCPLSYESLVAQLFYVRMPTFDSSPSGLLLQLQTNLDNVLRELQEYPPGEATKIARRIQGFLRDNNIPVRFVVPNFTTLVKLEYYA